MDAPAPDRSFAPFDSSAGPPVRSGLAARGRNPASRVASAAGPEARSRDAANAGTLLRSGDDADGPAPPQPKGQQGFGIHSFVAPRSRWPASLPSSRLALDPNPELRGRTPFLPRAAVGRAKERGASAAVLAPVVAVWQKSEALLSASPGDNGESPHQLHSLAARLEGSRPPRLSLVRTRPRSALNRRNTRTIYRGTTNWTGQSEPPVKLPAPYAPIEHRSGGSMCAYPYRGALRSRNIPYANF